MKYLKIQNNGELDIRLVALMGGTTKAKDEFKIGQFGTGLKYTLAYLIRNNVDFHIFVGETEVNIKTETENIKGEDFNIICINGNRTSITDKMGLEWKTWMIIRELWCNALDEGGALKESTEILQGKPDTTTFYIQVTEEVKKVMNEWKNYFIHDVNPLFTSDQYAIYPGGEDLRIYKQGVLIHEVKGKKCVFNYDMKNASINELRQFMGSPSQAVFKCLQNATPNIVDYFLTNCTEKHYEGSDCDYNWYESWGKHWKETIGDAKLIHEEAIKGIKSRGLDIDTSNLVIVPKVVYKALTKEIKGISALRMSGKAHEFFESYNKSLDERLKQALVVLHETGYDFSPKIKFVYGVFGDKNILAQVNHDTHECFVSERMLQSTIFEIVAMLIEENEHIKTGYQDHTREFQTHFIKLYAKQLMANTGIEV